MKKEPPLPTIRDKLEVEDKMAAVRSVSKGERVNIFD
jgi:hypothetical protein